jgi:hypothetical protein
MSGAVSHRLSLHILVVFLLFRRSRVGEGGVLMYSVRSGASIELHVIGSVFAFNPNRVHHGPQERTRKDYI